MNILWWALAFFAFFFSTANLMAAPSYPPRVGEYHPDFVLPRIDNRLPMSLSQFHGKKLLLINFASW